MTTLLGRVPLLVRFDGRRWSPAGLVLGLFLFLSLAPAHATPGSHPICGNGFVEFGEDCDDGNKIDGDCCSSECQFETGSCDDQDPCTVNDLCDKTHHCAGSPMDCSTPPGSCYEPTGTCSSGSCSYAFLPYSTYCEDGDPCTSNDYCDGFGGCSSGPPLSCDDANPCTLDSCDSSTGECRHPSDVGAPCNDGDACTATDTCSSNGVCAGGPPVTCDDSNPCTTDSCAPLTGCVFTPTPDAPCNDGNPCTTSDRCTSPPGGQTVGFIILCTGQPTPGVPCDDGNACTTGTSCSPQGSCSGGTTTNCDDHDSCTIDTCLPGTGCSHAPRGAGSSCDDGNACTTNDQCVGTCLTCNSSPPPPTGCVGSPINCNDNNFCTADSCDAQLGCLHPPTPGIPCNDGNACTTTDTCSAAGICGGPPLSCDDLNPCTTDSCIPQAGCQHDVSPPGTPCDDHNPCTTNDRCESAGGDDCIGEGCTQPVTGCIGGPPPSCDDGNPCTADSCNPSSGCVHDPVTAGTPCSDNNACTTGDACSAAGTCTGGAPPSCDDGNPCSVDGCNPQLGCTHAPLPLGNPCDDHNACTTNDTCQAPNTSCVGQGCLSLPVCTGGPALNCNDNNACTGDSCNPSSGCAHTTNTGAACDDGRSCTTNDTCTSDARCVGRDAAPPSIVGTAADPAFLWPPNHTMRSVTVNYSASDDCGGSPACQVSQVTSNEPENGTGDGDTAPDWTIVDGHHVQLRAERAGTGSGRIYTITVRCVDGSGNASTATTTVQVKHNIGSPRSGSAFRIGTPVSFAGTFLDVPGKTHTGQWQFDSLSTTGVITEPTATRAGSVSGTYTFTAAGVYSVKMNVTGSGLTGTSDVVDGVNDVVVVYDPNGGYVTGGGWLDSPAGALTSWPTLAGKVNFGFVSKYSRSATNPKGETEFDFAFANWKFNALNFDYLAVSGARAQYKGTGKVNGYGGYQFILTVIDGQAAGGGGVDRFRIKIWNKTTGAIVYDNQRGAPDNADPTTPVGTGSAIVIQQ